MRTIFITFWVFISAITVAHSTTWDEPWHETVLAQSESFVLAEITAVDEAKGLSLAITRNLAGKPLQGSVEVTDFFLLNLCSMSGGHGPEFRFSEGDTFYFFLRSNPDDGQFSIATPSTGFAYLNAEGMVMATYRHSYHQAMVPQAAYEQSMIALFLHAHGSPFDKQAIEALITPYLSQAPAGFEPAEIELFFGQHMAMETIYHLGLSGFESQLLGFLTDTSNFHNQVSAARALRHQRTAKTEAALTSLITDTTVHDFVQVMCIRSLQHIGPSSESMALLAAAYDDASDRSNGFGGNIMDPRVCTSLPTVKQALATITEMEE